MWNVGMLPAWPVGQGIMEISLCISLFRKNPAFGAK